MGPPTADVTVVNDDTMPVPVSVQGGGIDVTGSVEVTNFPAVQDVNVVNGLDPLLQRLLDTVVFTEQGTDANDDGILSGNEDTVVRVYQGTVNSFNDTFVALTIRNSGGCAVSLTYLSDAPDTTGEIFSIDPGEHVRVNDLLQYQGTIRAECSPCSARCQYTITDIREDLEQRR